MVIRLWTTVFHENDVQSIEPQGKETIEIEETLKDYSVFQQWKREHAEELAEALKSKITSPTERSPRKSTPKKDSSNQNSPKRKSPKRKEKTKSKQKNKKAKLEIQEEKNREQEEEIDDEETHEKDSDNAIESDKNDEISSTPARRSQRIQKQASNTSPQEVSSKTSPRTKEKKGYYTRLFILYF